MADKSDILIIPDTSGEVVPQVRGKETDSGLMLVQRLWVLMFAGHGSEYRKGMQAPDVLAFLDGANVPDDVTMNAMLATAGAFALAALDASDRAVVDSFRCTASAGEITGTLRLADGTTISSKLGHV